jgi:hypothetical protein
MRKFHSIAALCGDGLRPELQALFDRLAIDPRSELFLRDDGMVQAGPDPDSETAFTKRMPHEKMPESIRQAVPTDVVLVLRVASDTSASGPVWGSSRTSLLTTAKPT